MLATNRVRNDAMFTLMSDEVGNMEMTMLGGFNDDAAPFWIIKVERFDPLTADSEIVECPMFLEHEGAMTAWQVWELRIRN